MKVLWLKKGDPSVSTQSSSNAGNCSVSAALGSAYGIAEPPVPYNEPCTSGDMPCVQVAFCEQHAHRVVV